ncbi:unnamed protein product [marine sediment metagenome]|uniref:5'-3' exonuclease domain-containing protein n=1 Tax=marine sediment metagenome TaxID=412755 RepID=X1FG08_9ZZZZ
MKIVSCSEKKTRGIAKRLAQTVAHTKSRKHALVFGLTGELGSGKTLFVKAFDTPEVTFRKRAFKEYKAHRPKAPDELVSQIIEAHTLFKKLGITSIEQPGFEADDILGTLVEKFSSRDNLYITVLTGDLDTLQLVKNDTVTVLTPKKGVSQTVIYNEIGVKERFGVAPEHLTDYKGLVGDPSDNIPGVPGIGPKTAAGLLAEQPTLENLYRNLDKVKSKATAKKLSDYKEQAFLSKHLAIIRRDVPFTISLENLIYNKQYTKGLIDYFKKLGFTSLLRRLEYISESTTNCSSK